MKQLFTATLIFSASLICMLPCISNAQSLEMSTGNGPSGSGPSQSPQVVTFKKNTNNPTGNTFANYSPTQTVTYSYSDMQYPTGLFFGATINPSIATATADSIYSTIRGNNNMTSNNFTSTKPNAAGKGIDATKNYGIELYTSARPLYLASSPTTGSYYYGNLTLTFNNPINNPVINISSLGGGISGTLSIGAQYFTTDFILSENYSMTLLSGSAHFAVDNGTKKIYNSASPLSTTGAGDGGGSVLINGYNISSITFSLYLRGEGSPGIFGVAASTWGTSTDNNGDAYSIGVSLEEPFHVEGYEFDNPTGSGNYYDVDDATISGTNAAAANVILVDHNTGKVADYQTVSGSGYYSFNNVTYGNYDVMISNTTPTINSAAPSVVLSSGWVSTGETLDDSGDPDGNPDGKVSLGTVSYFTFGVTFGVEQLPVSVAQLYTISKPTVGSSMILNGPGTGSGSQPGPLQGSDPEDMPTTGSLSGLKIAITELPANGQLLYNGTQITKGKDNINPPSFSNLFLISDYDPTKLSIKFTGGGYLFSSLKYSYVDSASKLSPSSLYTLNWSPPLSLQLTQFSVIEQNCFAKINFATGIEEDVKEINIQYSVDGSEFTNIRTMAPKGSNSDYHFQYSPAASISEYHFYQLEIVDADGKKEYSDILKVSSSCGKKDNAIIITPNPAIDNFEISGMEGNAKKQIKILDVNGRLIHSIISFSAIEKINVSMLPSAVYIVQIIKDDKVIDTKKLYKR